MSSWRSHGEPRATPRTASGCIFWPRRHAGTGPRPATPRRQLHGRRARTASPAGAPAFAPAPAPRSRPSRSRKRPAGQRELPVAVGRGVTTEFRVLDGVRPIVKMSLVPGLITPHATAARPTQIAQSPPRCELPETLAERESADHAPQRAGTGARPSAAQNRGLVDASSPRHSSSKSPEIPLDAVIWVRCMHPLQSDCPDAAPAVRGWPQGGSPNRAG